VGERSIPGAKRLIPQSGRLGAKKKEVVDNLPSLLCKVDYFFALMADCAAESLAMGTLNGEQLT
jgi:hypothetical protein